MVMHSRLWFNKCDTAVLLMIYVRLNADIVSSSGYMMLSYRMEIMG